MPNKIFTTFVTMVPVAKARPRVTKTGHSYTPTKTVQAEHRIQEQVGREWPNPPSEAALTAVIWVYLEKPKSAKGRVFPTTRPDWDNYGKLVTDALNAILWKDDSFIVTGVVHKRFVDEAHPHPGFQIDVYDMSDVTDLSNIDFTLKLTQ